jgi:hypothetical protein
MHCAIDLIYLRKTQIALEYAYKSYDSGLDVFWVDCTSVLTLSSDFDKIQRTVEAIKKDDYEETRSAVLRWLELHDSWLTIFDNADDSTFPYSDWLPRKGGGSSARRILFTTRDARLSGATSGHQMEVPLMEEGEAVDLFNSNKPSGPDAPDRSQASIQSLVTRLGKLPLAISLASAYLREYPWVTVDQYLQQLNSYSDRPDLFNYKQAFSNYNHSIMSTWEMSFEKVNRDNPRAGKILLLLGFLANNQVVINLFQRTSATLSNERGGGRSQTALDDGVQFLQSELGLNTSLGLLRALALVYFDGKNISLHPLVHEWIQVRLRPDETVAWASKALSVVFNADISRK